VLFSESIFDNFVKGLTGTTHESADHETKRKLVVKACRLANAADLIEQLPEVSVLIP
jgi:ATP-binding cassette, subfamily B (MDR/TAP), member 1